MFEDSSSIPDRRTPVKADVKKMHGWCKSRKRDTPMCDGSLAPAMGDSVDIPTGNLLQAGTSYGKIDTFEEE